MYILRGNTIRNNARSQANAAQLHWLKEKYGDNWQKGAEKDPTVTFDPDYAKKKKIELEKQKEQKLNEAIVESAIELKKKGDISGTQLTHIVNIANQT